MKQDMELKQAFVRNLRELHERVHVLIDMQRKAIDAVDRAQWTHVGSLASINQALQDVKSHIRALQALGE